VSATPTGFSLESYEALVCAAADERVRLVLCDGELILEPALDDLGASVCERVRTCLRGAAPALHGGCFVQPVDTVDSRELRIVAVPEAPAGARDGARAARLGEVLAHVARCAGQGWLQGLELDDMTDELTGRYEELNLIYQMDRYASGEDEAVTLGAVRTLLEDAAAHLNVAALGLFSAEEELDLLVSPSGTRVDEAASNLLRAASAGLGALVRTHEDALVLNRPDDARRDASLRGVDAKFVAAPVGTGGQSGLVAGVRPGDGRDFTSSDRKLVSALADQIASFVRTFRDELTGLLNRRGFERRLEAHLDRDCARGGLLLHLDVHNFRVLNETCGRIAGDEMLRQVADVLTAATRGADLVARVGSDEFAILFTNCEPDRAPALAGDVVRRLQRNTFVWSGRRHAMSMSVGAVPLSLCEGDTGRLLSVAESTCDLAKEGGADSFRVYAEDDEQLFEKRGQVQWVPRLREALANDHFTLFAQVIAPVVESSNRQPHQEVLLRLRDEQGSLVPPVRFIPAAERFQLMPEVDRWVVTTTLGLLGDRRWRDAAIESVWSVNLSGQSLSDERFHQFLIDELERHDFPYSSLCFEVTETAAVENHRAATALITRLKALGVSFALDDFGSGLSSFAYLKSLPVDTLKIDGNFVKGLAVDPFSRATVEAVNRIGKVMGLRTVAEFVEDDATLAVLRDLGVDYAQGYGLGKPQPIERVLADLAARRGAPGGARVVPLRPDVSHG